MKLQHALGGLENPVGLIRGSIGDEDDLQSIPGVVELLEVLVARHRVVGDEHVQSAVRKLGAVNRTHAVALAIRDHLVEI